LGSIKPNIGHTDAAAGVASVIKVALMLKNKTLVPSINFNTINKNINIYESPFYINTRKTNWLGESLLAGVSSFGIGGTNAHIIMGNAAQHKRQLKEWPYELLVFSAKNKNTLTTIIHQFEDWYSKKGDTINISDIASSFFVFSVSSFISRFSIGL